MNLKALLGIGLLTIGLSAVVATAEPKFGLLGTPYSVNGDLSYDIYNRKHGGEGVHFSTTVQQGLEIAQFGPQDRFHLIPFVELRLKVGQDPNVYPWNSKLEEGAGIKVRYNVFEQGRHGGVIDAGVRVLHNDYLGSHGQPGVGIGGQAFVTYWFGGDWTKK